MGDLGRNGDEIARLQACGPIPAFHKVIDNISIQFLSRYDLLFFSFDQMIGNIVFSAGMGFYIENPFRLSN
jgi:hypothetical protein